MNRCAAENLVRIPLAHFFCWRSEALFLKLEAESSLWGFRPHLIVQTHTLTERQSRTGKKESRAFPSLSLFMLVFLPKR